MATQTLNADDYLIRDEPYYEPQGEEITLFEAAYRNEIAVLLKGPTGCGKTRFMEHMAWRLKRPLITVSCHDDLTASDLVGRYLIIAGETRWVDGPLARPCASAPFVIWTKSSKARKDTTVVIHPRADDRRVLPVEKTSEQLVATQEFYLAISYNPGYQSVLKDLKQNTRQRFVAIEFDYPLASLEKQIIVRESGIDAGMAERLVKFAGMMRNLKGNGLDEGASTPLLVHTGKLMADGIDPHRACRGAIAEALTDDPEMLAAVSELSASQF